MVGPTGPRWTLGAWRGLALAVLTAATFFGLGNVTPAAADPAASAWFETEQGRVRLIAAAPQIGAADTLRLGGDQRSEEHTSELQSHLNLVCRLLLEKKKKHKSN